jgi:hypothetical protein
VRVDGYDDVVNDGRYIHGMGMGAVGYGKHYVQGHVVHVVGVRGVGQDHRRFLLGQRQRPVSRMGMVYALHNYLRIDRRKQ